MLDPARALRCALDGDIPERTKAAFRPSPPPPDRLRSADVRVAMQTLAAGTRCRSFRTRCTHSLPT